ncbi:haloacid dehalogenase-like hydrolase [Saccharopolyspora sp. HNM0983]|uniref:Haloacid dehalogenase-like hydrolase n=1 Tax=Saccharopolyspora montiporae TaxID=2781240 RepID=A0A929B8T9_9PSEU|nr:haloacid dehalogenase-like hydrolase [Saccharopolyspora sp. HNM0983]
MLWDIDLTLVDARGFGTRWYARALAEVTGLQLERMPDTAGRTELAIASDVLRVHGVAVEETTVAALFDALDAAVADTREELARDGRAMPGAQRALHAASEEFVQTAVTGNLHQVARHKVGAFGLDRHLDLDIGGFGADSVHRHELITAAMAKAGAKHGTPPAAGSVVVVGDTPHDVAGALHHGAVAVGVATGGSSTDQLRAAGAAAVLPDLTDTTAVLAALRS